jgi:hypothetical protein
MLSTIFNFFNTTRSPTKTYLCSPKKTVEESTLSNNKRKVSEVFQDDENIDTNVLKRPTLENAYNGDSRTEQEIDVSKKRKRQEVENNDDDDEEEDDTHVSKRSTLENAYDGDSRTEQEIVVSKKRKRQEVENNDDDEEEEDTEQNENISSPAHSRILSAVPLSDNTDLNQSAVDTSTLNTPEALSKESHKRKLYSMDQSFSLDDLDDFHKKVAKETPSLKRAKNKRDNTTLPLSSESPSSESPSSESPSILGSRSPGYYRALQRALEQRLVERIGQPGFPEKQ